MPDISFRHDINCDEDTFWSQCIFDEEFNRKLYVDSLRFLTYKILEDKDGAEKRTRRIQLEPPTGNLPAPVKKVMGDSFSYVEEASFDKKTKRYTFKTITSSMPDKITVTGELFCEKKGDKQIVRVAKISVAVKVFMIGGMIEEKLISDLRASYDSSATFTNAFLKEKGL